MKWHHSIIFKITLIFLLAFIGIGAVFVLLAHHRDKNDLMHAQHYVQLAIRSSFDRATKEMDWEKLKEAGFENIETEPLRSTIIEHAKLAKKEHKNALGEPIRPNLITIFYQDFIYAVAKRPRGETIVLLTPYKKEVLSQFVFPVMAYLFIFFLYIGILKSILPVKSLREKIRLFANGDYDIECSSEKKDEIAGLANEFDSAVKKIKGLRDSRQLFLRNIMHELKTPITKGKLAIEMFEDSTYKDILKNVFKRQETLLDEFSRIEKLSADELKLHIAPYKADDIVDFALDIIDEKRGNITQNIKPIILHVDLELFATALKNLLDNALNYSADNHAAIDIKENTIVVSNKGEPLECPLEDFAKPYFMGTKKQKSSRGLGFGLYIVWHILRLHKMKITYDRKNDTNFFTIYF
ncbi:MAG: ArsS family sensor histidine kinase [Sulfurospirillaceae bacterium]|nr:ArsS family sensor histidine kinase [Sulfurospirillaceae bacterium]MDD3463193.1 ArsS family sensor histidine kinase [Sulfurospirillaceae bacterium]